MKRYLSILLLTITATLASYAQEDFSINRLFDGRYRNNPSATETVMKGGALKEYDVSLYHSITLNGIPSETREIERLVTRDGASAVEKEVSYRKGALYYGFYEFPMLHGKHRYIFYLNQYASGSGDKVILIYLEGAAQRDKIKKLLK